MKLISLYVFLFLNFSVHAGNFHFVDCTQKYSPAQAGTNFKTGRLIWGDDLERLFRMAYNELDEELRTPTQILQRMQDEPNSTIAQNLTRLQVASHLQKFRQKALKARSAAAREVLQNLGDAGVINSNIVINNIIINNNIMVNNDAVIGCSCGAEPIVNKENGEEGEEDIIVGNQVSLDKMSVNSFLLNKMDINYFVD